jgi:hypothetical protein
LLILVVSRAPLWFIKSATLFLMQLAKLREAIETHNTARCSLGPAVGVGPDFDWEAAAKANAAAAAANKAAAAH